MTPRYYILTDRDNECTLIFVHNGGKSYGNENYQLIGKLPFTGLDYTIAMDRRLQYRNNLALTGGGGGQAVILMPFAPDAEGMSAYALNDANGERNDADKIEGLLQDRPTKNAGAKGDSCPFAPVFI